MFSIQLFKKFLRPHLSFCRCINNNPDLILIPEVDESVLKGLESGHYLPYTQPGKSKAPFSQLDDDVQETIIKIMGDSLPAILRRDADNLSKVLAHRQVPLSKEDLKDKSAICYWDIYKKMNIDLNSLPDEKFEKVEKKMQKDADKLLKQRVQQWYPIEYNRYVGKQYLINRMAPEFAVLRKVFNEIKTRCPDFRPDSLFDLGSGVGTVTLAARKFWEGSIKEYLNVDASRDMIQLAREVLTNGDPEGELPIKNLFYKQFMPAKANRKYSLTVCSYALLDFHSVEERLKNIMMMWNKTEDFMVLVEKGDMIGFRLILEARDFILETDKLSENSRGVHVFAPCAHELPCPMTGSFEKACRSNASYERLPISRTRFVFKETFCFLILKKGSRPEDDPQWPRVVCPSKVKSKRTHCYLCTKDGKVRHFLFRSSQHGTVVNQMCRATKMGERLPVNFLECNIAPDNDTPVVEAHDIENLDELPENNDS